MSWYVTDMDDGILVRRQHRRDCLNWVLEHVGATRVLERQSYGAGAYDYRVAGCDPEDSESFFIIREDRLKAHGFTGSREPLYGDANNPHTPTRETDEHAS